MNRGAESGTAPRREVVCYEPFFVAGLLQTQSYASVIHRQGYAKARSAEHDLAVEFRVARQRILHVEQSLYLGDVEALARYTDLFARLRHTALPPMDVSVPPEGYLAKDSLGLIQRLLYPLL